MRRTPSLRDRLAISLVAASLAAFAVPGALPEARGQVPGPEIFMREPQTPMELWDATDYLVRTGQVQQALPYLNKFLKSRPDDATLLEIRDRYGVRSILQLDNYPETRPLARPLAEMLAAASRRNATRAERIGRYVAALTKTSEEQQFAVEQLREAGPYAVPFLVQALDRADLSPEDRALIVSNLGRLDASAVPPLIATLDSADVRLVVDAADALGRIGDARAVPQLTYLAAPEAASPARDSARLAIARLTGRPFASQRVSPVRVLADEARRYHLHAVRFPGDSVLVWSWDPAAKVPAPRQVSRSEAESLLGLRLAREALRLAPADLPAQVVLVSLALEKAVERTGIASFPAADPSNAFAAALAAGPEVLGRALRTAIADGKMDLAAAAATALGQVTDRQALAIDRRVNPLIEALSAPSRRVQFAAARALVLLEPRRAFAGSSQVVPILARFVMNQGPPRAVVIDGNPTRGGRLASYLQTLGYEPTLAATGDQGFRAAAESADVELIAIDAHLIQGAWRLVDTLSNLRADARTAGIPIYVVGPLSLQAALDATFANAPGVKFVVTPTDAEILGRQIGGRPAGLSEAERTGYAREAAGLLAQVAARPGSPFEPDLGRAEAALAIALNTPPTSLAASATLGDVPDADAQRGLADFLLDPSRPAAIRLVSAGQLARSLQRFGPLVTADQEARLLAALDQERDPALQSALAAVVGALRPKPALAGLRLQQYDATPGPPAQAPTAPGAASSPPTPESATPAAAEAPVPPADAKP